MKNALFFPERSVTIYQNHDWRAGREPSRSYGIRSRYRSPALVGLPLRLNLGIMGRVRELRVLVCNVRIVLFCIGSSGYGRIDRPTASSAEFPAHDWESLSRGLLSAPSDIYTPLPHCYMGRTLVSFRLGFFPRGPRL